MKIITIPVTPLQQNCSILICEKTGKGAVVDPGGDSHLILEKIKELNVEIELILVTHGHVDHCGHVHDLSENLNVRVEGPNKKDHFWIEQLPNLGQMYDMGILHKFKPDRWLDHGDIVNFGNIIMQVMHCPGHSPGHVIFFHEKSQQAIVGDVIFSGSIGRTDLAQGSHDDLVKSIATILWPLGDDITFFPGHGPVSTFRREKETNPFVSLRALSSGS